MTMSYADIMSRINVLLREIEKNDDIDDVLNKYEEATQHLNECESRLKNAKGRFEAINMSLESSR